MLTHYYFKVRKSNYSNVSATDKVTFALPDDVTIAGEFTASGTGTHTLGQISFASTL